MQANWNGLDHGPHKLFFRPVGQEMKEQKRNEKRQKKLLEKGASVDNQTQRASLFLTGEKKPKKEKKKKKGLAPF